MRTIPISVLGVLVMSCAAVACGSSDGDNAATGGAGGSSGNGGGAGTAGAAGAANPDPCGINSGYDGDERCILAPTDPAKGVLLHFGPADYSPASVAPFLLQPGDEITRCFYQKTTNPADAYINEYHGHLRPGSHHMRLFAISGDKPDGPGPCGLTDTLGSRFLFGGQTPTLDVPLPGERFSVDYEDFGITMPKLAQMAMEVHFINTTDKPILEEAWATFGFRPDKPTVLGDGIAMIGGFASINTRPNTAQTVHFQTTVQHDVDALILVGHYHAHTTRFSAWWTAVGTTDRQLVNESYDYHEPATLRYDSVHQNATPDAATKTDGGWSGKLAFKKGDKFEWECEIHNDNTNGVPVSQTPLTFANEVYTGEMCNVFGLYAPSFGNTWNVTQP